MGMSEPHFLPPPATRNCTFLLHELTSLLHVHNWV